MKTKIINAVCKVRFLAVLLLLTFAYTSTWATSTTITVSIATHASSNSWTNGTRYGSIALDSYITASVSPYPNDSYTGQYRSDNNWWQVFESEAGSLTITSTAGAMSSIKIVYDNNNDGVLKDGSSTVANNTAYSVSGQSVTLYAKHSTGTKNGRIDIKSISVTYDGCDAPANALDITSSSSVMLGSTLSLTSQYGNGGTVVWSVVAGTGTATVVGTTLTPVTPGTVTVKAHQNLNGDYCAQDDEMTVTINKREATIVLSEAGSETSVSGTHYELDSYSLPSTSSESCGDKVLVGWSKVEVEETDTKPSSNYYAKGTSVTLGPGENYFYAVYATATAGTGPWEKYTSSTIAEGDYLIVHASYNYAMTNVVTDNTLGSQFVSINNDTISYNSTWASNCTWHITPSGDYYTIKNGSNYVIGTGTSSQANLSTSPSNNNEKFSMTFNSDPKTYKFVNAYNSAQSVSAVLKRGGSGPGAKYACYADASPYPNLFKRGYGYTEYSTDCCEKPATALSITSANTVAMGNTITLNSNGGNGASITWTVTAGSGAGSITTGVFTPSSAGTVTIKAHQDQNTVLGTKYCAQDVEQEVTITVNTTGVEVDPTSKAIVVDETFTITPTVAPADATDKTVSWSSSAEGKASVTSAGLVTGVAAGSATITCTTTNGSYTADCAVTVYGVTLAVTDDEGTDISATIDLPLRSGINITPAANANNYVFDHWTLTNATLGSSSTTEDNTITSPTGAVTVTAVYLPGVEIRWYVNGEEWTAGDPSTSVESGTQYKDLTYPTDPTPGDACGNRFVGWTDHSMGAASGQSAPTPLLRSGNSDTTPITTAKEFHAVFANYAN